MRFVEEDLGTGVRSVGSHLRPPQIIGFKDSGRFGILLPKLWFRVGVWATRLRSPMCDIECGSTLQVKAVHPSYERNFHTGQSKKISNDGLTLPYATASREQESLAANHCFVFGRTRFPEMGFRSRSLGRPGFEGCGASSL